MVYEGLKISSCQETANQDYLYATQDTQNRYPSVTKIGETDSQGTDNPNGFKTTEGGFYVYDLKSLCEGKILSYQMAPDIGG